MTIKFLLLLVALAAVFLVAPSVSAQDSTKSQTSSLSERSDTVITGTPTPEWYVVRTNPATKIESVLYLLANDAEIAGLGIGLPYLFLGLLGRRLKVKNETPPRKRILLGLLAITCISAVGTTVMMLILPIALVGLPLILIIDFAIVLAYIKPKPSWRLALTGLILSSVALSLTGLTNWFVNNFLVDWCNNLMKL